jgi:hypothetical protein
MLVQDLTYRLRWGGMHLLVSLIVGSVIAVFMLTVLYPPPFHIISGGLGLMGILLSVDIVLGPMLTLAVANKSKQFAVLKRDVLCIGCLQLLALGYGVYAAHTARPVYEVLEVDRIRVVTAADIDPTDLSSSKSSFANLPVFGIERIGVREPKDEKEKLALIDSALQGKDLALHPDMWIAWGKVQNLAVTRKGKTIKSLEITYPKVAASLREFANHKHLNIENLIVLPVQARTSDYSAVFDSVKFDLVGYIEGDSF